MIEVTTKNSKGVIITLETMSERDFGIQFRYRHHQTPVAKLFTHEYVVLGTHREYIHDDSMTIKTVVDFSFVAYNEKGKVLDPSYLVGLTRKDWWERKQEQYVPGAKGRWWGGNHVHERWRLIHNTPERRATFANDDQEDASPNIRGKRKFKNLPHSWNWWDEEYRDKRNRNWKKFRKHQWKD